MSTDSETLRVFYEDLEYDDSNDGTARFNGVPFTGMAVEVFSDGAVWIERPFCNGQQAGLQRTWFQSGNIESEKSVIGFTLHGACRWYRECGAIMKDGEWEYGICLWSKEWDSTGVLKKDYEIQDTDVAHRWLLLCREAAARLESSPPQVPESDCN